jgi:hypothetical protein
VQCARRWPACCDHKVKLWSEEKGCTKIWQSRNINLRPRLKQIAFGGGLSELNPSLPLIYFNLASGLDNPGVGEAACSRDNGEAMKAGGGSRSIVATNKGMVARTSTATAVAEF